MVNSPRLSPPDGQRFAVLLFIGFNIGLSVCGLCLSFLLLLFVGGEGVYTGPPQKGVKTKNWSSVDGGERRERGI